MKSSVKKYFIFSLFSLILLISIFPIDAVVSHPASELWVNIDGTDRTLEYAADNSLLTGTHTYSAPTSISDPGHSVSELWISTDNGERTLLSALQNKVNLKKTSFSGMYSSNLNLFHSADQVLMRLLNKDMQTAINDQEFYCAPTTCTDLRSNCGTWSDGCGGTLNCGSCERGKYCNNGQCEVSYTYSWDIGNWGACSGNECSGTASRNVYCRRSDGIIVYDYFCTTTKPTDSASCTCKWEYKSYSDCRHSVLATCSYLLGEFCRDEGSLRECKIKNSCGTRKKKATIYNYQCVQKLIPDY